MTLPADAIIAANPGAGEASAPAAAVFSRVAQSTKPAILFVTHGRAGGVARPVAERAALLQPHAEVLVLRPHLRSFVALECVRDPAAPLWFHATRDWEGLVTLLRALGLARVHYHHVQGLPPRVLDLGREAGCPWDVTVHDYYPACPQYQLTDAAGRYCGEPDEDGCTRCLAAAPAQWPMGIAEWRAAFGRLLGGAARVIAPSQDAAARIARHFPGVAPLAWAHPGTALAAPRACKVLVLGGLSPAKGMALLEACAQDARRRALPLTFRVVGHVAWPLDEADLPVSFTGAFAEGGLPRAIEQERGDAILFPAQWPETWSYTLSDALACGLPIVATAVGAFVERLRGVDHARTLPVDAAPEAFNDALLALAGVRAPTRADAGAGPSGEDYAARYVAAIAPRAAPVPAPAVAPPGIAAPPHEALPQAKLAELFDDGVRCGNARSLAELRARIREADRALEAAAGLAAAEARAAQRVRALEGELARLEAALAQSGATVDTASERIAALESSTSWRITAPLRALARRLRR